MTVQPMLNDDGMSDQPSYLDYAVTRYDAFIVDQTLARVDADVTCMLTVTANDTYVYLPCLINVFIFQYISKWKRVFILYSPS